FEEVLENMQLFLGPQLQAFETEFAGKTALPRSMECCAPGARTVLHRATSSAKNRGTIRTNMGNSCVLLLRYSDARTRPFPESPASRGDSNGYPLSSP